MLTKCFCQVEAIVDTKGNPVKDSSGHPLIKIPSPRVELSYTCLMAWYTIHCLSLMTTVSAPDDFAPFVQQLENSNWIHSYMFYIRKIVLNGANYQLDRCFPEILDASYGDKFADLAGLDRFTRLPSGVFWWVINIRPGYLIFCQGNSVL